MRLILNFPQFSRFSLSLKCHCAQLKFLCENAYMSVFVCVRTYVFMCRYIGTFVSVCGGLWTVLGIITFCLLAFERTPVKSTSFETRFLIVLEFTN